MEFEVVRKYGLNVKSITPYRDGFIIDTGKVQKLLKRPSYSKERVQFIHGAKEHLYKNGLTDIDRFICVENGTDTLPYIVHEDRMYTLADYPGGRECNFDNDNELEISARLLAQLHVKSKGFESSRDNARMFEIGDIRLIYKKHLEELKKLKKMAVRGRHEFDFSFMKCIDYYYNQGLIALQSLDNSGYDAIVQRTVNEKSFCHRDYSYNNILFSRGKPFIINFDQCVYEIRVYDLVNMIKRKMRKCNWDINSAKSIIKFYGELEPLSPEEMKVMLVMFRFPQKFWRIANRYNNSRRTWTEKSYDLKIQEALEEKEHLEVFLKEFEKLL
jgi:spore coat protein I